VAGIQDLEGKTVVVTGGGSGIGGGMIRRFAKQGMQVVVADIEGDSAELAAKALREEGARAIGIACDVSKRSDVAGLADAAIAEFGAVDVACNNAGIFFGGKLRELQHMAERGSGHIVNTASIGGWAPDPNCAPYTTSKFAVVGFSEALRRDLEEDGVGVSILCPGPVATGMAKADRLRPASAGPSAATSLAAEPVMAVGMPPDDVGDLVIDGIRENATYVFTHPDFGVAFEPRFDEMRRALARAPKPRTGDVSPEDLS